MVKTPFLFLMLIMLGPSLLAQIQLEYIFPSVSKDDVRLDLAFAGGINSAQYQTVDLDGDEDLDLVIFDRSSDKINTFENTGSSYIYQPAFEYLFPENIQHWLVLADYDCDGYKDLFTYTGQGIRVFRNTSSGGEVSWQEVANPIKTQGSSSLINLFFNPTDIPSITDLDQDGDLDILVFDFASSSQIEFHKNLSVENGGSCALDFVRETRNYGEVIDCGCDAFLVGEPCGSSGRILHAGGKALLSLDYDTDGLMDLVLSQEACENLNYARNIGTIADASFAPFENTFPTMESNLGFTSFPAAFFEDVTFDGKKDLLTSSNERSNPDQNIDFKSSSILYENIGASADHQFGNSKPFLQDRMIDVGEYAYPAIEDINGDGQNDLIIGNAGSLVGGEYISTLTYYRANNSELVWQTNDFLNLASLGYTHIKPQFINLNNDEKVDLVFSAVDADLNVRFAYIINDKNSLIELDPSAIQFIDAPFTRLDDFVLHDLDDDGLPDLLVGLSSGQLDYYKNTGDVSSPMFTLETESYLGIGADSDGSNLSLSTGDLDGDALSDLITTDRSGQIRVYSNFQSESTDALESIIRIENYENLVSSRLGRISKPTSGQLLGRDVIAIGSIQGGVRLFASGSSSEGIRLAFSAFPVPSSEDKRVSFQSNLSNTHVEIYSLAGNKVVEFTLSANMLQSVDLSFLEEGLYLAKAKHQNQNCTVKVIVH